MSRRFVPGEGVEDLVGAIRQANAEGMSATGNYLGESVKTERAASQAASVYTGVMDQVQREALDANVSVKFSQLGQAISEEFLAETLAPILERSRRDGIFVRFDMESSAYTQRTLDAFEKLWSEGWRNIGVVLQAYLHRTAGDVARMNQLGARVRLCKGAYDEPAKIAYKEREDVAENFTALMRELIDHGNYPGIATHDERLIEATLEHVTRNGIPSDRFEFQMLFGVRRDLQRQLVDDGWNMRVYVPFGEQWYPYLMRRLAERPANLLLLIGSVVRESPLGFLWGGRDRTNRKA
ncbi:MAG: proline dehydrogenase family protein [Gemmatimonadota bacterium]|nr:proline dehydrogenase family protein [Gemmatimonadota bacterium]